MERGEREARQEGMGNEEINDMHGNRDRYGETGVGKRREGKREEGWGMPLGKEIGNQREYR